ncbi:PPOX class F420-dependent oxidoreductase [Litorivivens sp.]|uniref:PPOX class F420-dependent oxidoreductase n=1 Tax=Litorivivens sp. TaxID=2020868 RepID=UPI00356B0E1E
MSELDKHQYVLLGTRKKDGSMVDTPVWFAQQGKTVYMFSAGNAGKVKRLRNFSDARLAPCTVSGKALGEFVPATATLLDDDASVREAHQQLVKKYGWQMRLLDLGARLGGRIKSRAFIKAELN